MEFCGDHARRPLTSCVERGRLPRRRSDPFGSPSRKPADDKDDASTSAKAGALICGRAGLHRSPWMRTIHARLFALTMLRRLLHDEGMTARYMLNARK